MLSNIQLLYIIGGSGSCFIIVCIIKHYNQLNRELINLWSELMLSHRVNPIIQISDEELKDEFEQYEIRTPQINGEENV